MVLFKKICDVAKVAIIPPLEDIVKFGYKGNKKVKTFRPSLNFWLPIGTK
jgi:hypothetical protein